MRLWQPLMRWLRALESFQASIALVSAIAALAAALIASWQIWESRKAAEAQAYLEMRQRFLNVAQKLDAYGENAPLVRDTQQWKDFRSYWYISFDEWYITRKLGVFPDLWETYYAEAFARARNKRNMQATFCELRTTDFSKGIRYEFALAVEKTYKDKTDSQGPCT